VIPPATPNKRFDRGCPKDFRQWQNLSSFPGQEALELYRAQPLTNMARHKPQEHNNLQLPVVLSEQIIPGSFAFVLNYLVNHELDLSALDARFKNDETGASAYDPRVMLNNTDKQINGIGYSWHYTPVSV